MEVRWQTEERGDQDSVKKKEYQLLRTYLKSSDRLLENLGSKRQFMCSWVKRLDKEPRWHSKCLILLV